MAVYNYDVVVLGSGPAGEGAAINAVKAGRKVAVVDDRPQVGGNCTHLGTIPSKALRHSVRQIMQYNNNPLFRQIGDPRWFSFPDVLKSAEKVIGKQVSSRTGYYARNRIDTYFGTASFADEHSVEVVMLNGAVEKLVAKDIVIATGSRPYRPADVDFTHPRIYDSDTILKLTHTPRRIIIYGAGVIGCEYASIFSGLGVLVDLIDNRDQLLSFLDDEISDALSYHLRTNNVLIRHNEEYERVEGVDHGVVLHLKSGKKIKADAFLWCNGRTGNTDKLALENVGLKANSRGQIHVDEHYRTAVPNIYAAGDVIGWPSLASAAFDQGRSAAGSIVDNNTWRFVDDVPTGIYSIPEISSIGKNRARADPGQGALRSRQGVLQEHGARADLLRAGRHAQAALPPRNPGSARRALLRLPGVGDRAHRPGDHEPEGRRQYHQVFRQHHLQLPDHGRSLPGGGVRRAQPAFLSGSARWPEPGGEDPFSNSRAWRWPNRESL